MYEEVIKQLQASFGAASVSHGRRPYIPSQVYMLRLEQIAGELWSWRIVSDPVIDVQNMLVTVRGEIQLLDAIRQGIGIAVIQKVEPASIKNAISSAESDAFRDCCDKFLMGWKDLASSRDWGLNPTIKAYLNDDSKVLTESYTSVVDASFEDLIGVVNGKAEQKVCSVCSASLTMEEELHVKKKGIRYFYCNKHLPKQFK